ncbi:MAG: GNAT family N-acetyltransferase [Candidatus Saccharimonadales bacterium]
MIKLQSKSQELPSLRFEYLPPGSPHWAEALPILQQLRSSLDSVIFNDLYDKACRLEGLRYTASYEDDTCVAVVGAREMTLLSISGTILFIDDFVVDTARRGEGIGKATMADVLQYASLIGCSAVALYTGSSAEGSQWADLIGMQNTGQIYVSVV